MMKKLAKSLVLILVLMVAISCFVACNQLEEGSISFKTFNMDGTDASIVVGNEVETFDFSNEIKVEGNVRYVVAFDISGSNQALTKIVELNEGDNTFYVIEMKNNSASAIYKTTIRRRPMYEVTFVTGGGTKVNSQTVEEDGFIQSVLNPEREGYEFAGWDYDFNTPVTNDVTITAQWTARYDTPYTVEYYLESLDGEYDLIEDMTETKYGMSGSTIKETPKTIDHFYNDTTLSTARGKITADGNLTLKLYYSRSRYQVFFNLDGGKIVSGQQIQIVKYGGSAVAPTVEKPGYKFVGFDKTFDNISGNIQVNVIYEVAQIPLTIVYGNGQPNYVVDVNYGAEIPSIDDPEEKPGYDFAGWDKEIPETMPAEGLTITAKWKAIYNVLEGKIIGLTSYGKTLADLKIPSEIDGVEIMAIEENAFSYWEPIIKSVAIPDSITEIGKQAFEECKLLETVTFGENSKLETIAHSAFRECKALKSIVIPNGVTSIGFCAFEDCTSLVSAIIPESVASIGTNVFENCTSLTYLTIPFVGASLDGTDRKPYLGYLFGADTYRKNKEFVPTSLKVLTITGGTAIDDDAFSNCDSLSIVNLYGDVTKIGRRVFENCTNLTRVGLPATLNTVDYNGFYNCSGLVCVDFLGTADQWVNISFDQMYSNPLYYAHTLYIDGVRAKNVELSTTTKISDYAFINCVSLESITIPDSVTTIGLDAFYSCPKLTSVTIPNNVTTIEESTFSNCNLLESVTFGENSKLESISNYAFKGCGNLKSIAIPDSVTVIGEYAFSSCRRLESVAFWEDCKIESIGTSAFSYCTALTSIKIPLSVTTMGSSVFDDCDGLVIYCEAKSAPSGWSTTWNYSKCPVVWDCNNNDVASDGNLYVIEEGVKYGIKDGVASVLAQQKNITSANILSTIIYNNISYDVTSIGANAFLDCTLLETVSFETNSKITSVGNSAFYGCKALESITLPNSVTQIGDYAFVSCEALSSITIPDDLTSIGRSIVSGTAYYKDQSNWENDILYVGKYLVGTNTSMSGAYTIREGTEVITSYVFSNRGLSSITIPSSVTYICDYAFYNCDSLETVTVADDSNLISIGKSSFYRCGKLKTVDFGENSALSSIGTSAFTYCSLLSSIKIPNNTMVIDAEAFYYCTSLATVTFEENSQLTKIGRNAFTDSVIRSIAIPDSVTIIGESAFSHCTVLTSVTFGENSQLTEIGVRAFSSCSALTSIAIPDSVTIIGSWAFNYCTALKSISLPFTGDTLNGTSKGYFGYIFSASSYQNNASGIPANLNSVTITKKVGSYAFYDCTMLTSITLTEGVTSIGTYAFYNCTKLTSIEIPDSVTSIGTYAFDNTAYYKDESNWENGLMYANSYLISAKDTLSGAVTIKDGTKTISANIFTDNTSLTSITIPSSVEQIGANAFINCSGLERVNYGGTIDEWVEINFSNNYSNPLFYAKNLYINDTLVTDAVLTSATKIQSNAFYNCESLKSIQIPNSVTCIGTNAFYGCKSLISIQIPNGVTSIESKTFYGCKSLISIQIPNGVTSIGSYAFFDCIALESIDLPDNLTQISDSMLRGCTSLKSVTIPKTVTSIGSYAFYGCSSLITVSMQDGVTTINSYAFYNCVALTDVTIPETVTRIDMYAFCGCTALESIIIPDSVKSMGSNVFRECTALKIYCELESKPSTWGNTWNYSDRPVVWGYTGE